MSVRTLYINWKKSRKDSNKWDRRICKIWHTFPWQFPYADIVEQLWGNTPYLSFSIKMEAKEETVYPTFWILYRLANELDSLSWLNMFMDSAPEFKRQDEQKQECRTLELQLHRQMPEKMKDQKSLENVQPSWLLSVFLCKKPVCT